MLISDFKHGLFKYEVKDYYAILGVPVTANAKEIRIRYLKLAYQLHPDTNRVETKAEKDRDSSILSKILNPAYENLYKDKLRRECQLIFSDIANRLISDLDKITFSSEIAKKLLQEDQKKLEKLYEETIDKIRKDQYQDFNKIPVKIGLLSELNMIYLVRQKQEEASQVTGRNYRSTPIASSEGVITQATRASNDPGVSEDTTIGKKSSTTQQEPLTPLEKLIMNATKHIETSNYEPALFDLREAVKLDANSAVAHALLGSVYLEQDNKTYGRIHINKAVSLDSDHPEVKKAQKKLEASDGKTKPEPKKPGKSSQKSQKDQGKKEAPKIFGIPLW